MVKAVARLLLALFDNSNPSQLASGIVLGFLMALIPRATLLWPVIFIFLWFFRWNRGAFAIALLIFLPVAPLLDPLVNPVGRAVIGWEPLFGFFNGAVNSPGTALMNLNNTAVTGSVVLSLLFFFPLFSLVRALVLLVKTRLLGSIMESRLVKSLRKIPFFNALGNALSRGNALFRGAAQ